MADKYRSPILILAGEYRDARDWLYSHNLPRTLLLNEKICRYVNNTYVVQGIKRGFYYVVLDTFIRHSRCLPIAEIVADRKGRELADSEAIIKIKDYLNG